MDLSDFRHKTLLNLRFVDMDAFGHVNNANYLTYFEQARIKYYDDIVQWEYDWSKEGIIMARAEIDFKEPVYFKDEVSIYTRSSKIGTKSITNEYVMVKKSNGSETVVASGLTIAVAYNYEKNIPVPVSDQWRKAIGEFEGKVF